MTAIPRPSPWIVADDFLAPFQAIAALLSLVHSQPLLINRRGIRHEFDYHLHPQSVYSRVERSMGPQYQTLVRVAGRNTLSFSKEEVIP